MSLSADSEIFLLTANIIKAIADKLKIPQSRLHSKFKSLQMNIISQSKPKTFSCRRLETESYFEKIAFLISAVRRRYGHTPKIMFQNQKRLSQLNSATAHFLLFMRNDICFGI